MAPELMQMKKAKLGGTDGLLVEGKYPFHQSN